MLKDMNKNPLLHTDGYNLSHQRLKCNTDWEVSHMYNRKRGMILYGFEEIINNILHFTVEQWMIDEAVLLAAKQGVLFPRELFQRVISECGGRIPLLVEALPEGTWCPAGTPFAQIRNTVEGFGELVSWWEGVFMNAYFPSACATRALEIRRYIEERCEGGYNWEQFKWRVHSFGFRGHRSSEDAYWAGTAWSMFLFGSDDFHITTHLAESGLVSGTIAALAHKVTQQYDSEMMCFEHAIDATAAAGEKIVAMVIDTYDAWHVINAYVPALSAYAYTKGLHLVFRPDSGDVKEQVEAIYNIVITQKLPNVTCIIGDSLTFSQIIEADKWFVEHHVPLDFINYGLGAGFYNDITRDYLGWAMKTAFSNGTHRMKLVKGTPEKQSIPGVVNIYYDKMELIVDRSAGTGLYTPIYWHSKITDLPALQHVDYGEIARRALSQDTSQKRINISQDIQQLIREFQIKYWEGEIKNG